MSGVRTTGWFPLERALLDSSVWETDPEVRVLWITMLLVASEPGRRGIVDVPVRMLAARACLTPESTRAALEVLASPDPHSRSAENGGRRIAKLDDHREWGWRILNWEKYENARFRAGNTLLQRDIRRKRAAESVAANASPEVTGVSPNVITSHEDVTEHRDREARCQTGEERRGEESTGEGGNGGGNQKCEPTADDLPSAIASDRPPALFEDLPEREPRRRGPSAEDLRRVWNENRGPLAECLTLSPGRLKHAVARIRAVPDLARWERAIKRLVAPFARGEVGRNGWRASFDYLVRPDTLTHIEEGALDRLLGGNGSAPAGPRPETADERKQREAFQREWGAPKKTVPGDEDPE